MLVQSTLAHQLSFSKLIGHGRFGQVWQGRLKNERDVAIKLFSSDAEDSWRRELSTYEIKFFRHHAILGYVCADVMFDGNSMRYLLITDFHPLGSLHDALLKSSFTLPQVANALCSVADGLDYLHSEIIGTTWKPRISHGDLKSKNVLVKHMDGTCCIGDFGLSVHESEFRNKKAEDIREPIGIGTRRYVAPELLAGTFDASSFTSYLLADIYSLALCFWEIVQRCHMEGLPCNYEYPYNNEVPLDPSVEDVKLVVHTRGIRPKLPSKKLEIQEFNAVYKLLENCWDSNPQARPSAHHIKRKICKIFGIVH